MQTATESCVSDYIQLQIWHDKKPYVLGDHCSKATSAELSSDTYPFDKVQEHDSSIRVLRLVCAQHVREDVHALESILFIVCGDDSECQAQKVVDIWLNGLILRKALQNIDNQPSELVL